MTILVCLSANLFAQEERTTKITVSGQGKTLDDARQSALRSAIEQAFGAFISSKTEVLNDNLVKDEIVSIANGNIQKYSILSEVEIPNIGYATTLEAIVSINKLTKFCESKGIQVEFAGSLFGANMKQQKLNEEAETKAIINLCETSKEILKKALDFEVAPSEPKNVGVDKFEISYNITLKGNENYAKFQNYFFESLVKIGMNSTDSVSYLSLDKPFFAIAITKDIAPKNPLKMSDPLNKKVVLLRNNKSLMALKNFFVYSCQYAYDFRINTDIDTIQPIGPIGFCQINENDSAYVFETSNFSSFKGLDVFIKSSNEYLGVPNSNFGFFSEMNKYQDLFGFKPKDGSNMNIIKFLTADSNYYSVNPYLLNECYYSGSKNDYCNKYGNLEWLYSRTGNNSPLQNWAYFKIEPSYTQNGTISRFEVVNINFISSKCTFNKVYSVAEIEKISKVSIVNLNNQP